MKEPRNVLERDSWLRLKFLKELREMLKKIDVTARTGKEIRTELLMSIDAQIAIENKKDCDSRREKR